MEKGNKLFSLFITIFILTLTINTIIVQAAAPTISLTILGEGQVDVIATTNKGKPVEFGSYTEYNIIKLSGNLDSIIFILTPNSNFHVSAIKQDDTFIEFNNDNLLLIDEETGVYSYELLIETKQHSIEVTFSEEGIAIVPQSTVATVFLGTTASLTVDNSGNPQPITFRGIDITNFYQYSKVVWEITTDDTTGSITIALLITLEEDDKIENVILQTSNLEYPNADVNDDDVINAEDVKAVSSVNPGTSGDDPDYRPYLDINHDLVIDNLDVTIVSGYNPTYGPIWTDIAIEDKIPLGNNQYLIIGQIPHFSIFRCR